MHCLSRSFSDKMTSTSINFFFLFNCLLQEDVDYNQPKSDNITDLPEIEINNTAAATVCLLLIGKSAYLSKIRIYGSVGKGSRQGRRVANSDRS